MGTNPAGHSSSSLPCPRVDAMWDDDDAVSFRDVCRHGIGLASVCEGGEVCPLAATGPILLWPRMRAACA